MRQYLIRTGSISFGVAALLACGGDSTGPSQGPPVGSYSAFQFQTTGGSGSTNQLLIGSTVQINLAANGTTNGHLHLAASSGNPSVDADMAGTWSQNGNLVNFTQPADTFVRNMVFTFQLISNNVWDLVGDQVFNGTRIQLTLRHGP